MTARSLCAQCFCDFVVVPSGVIFSLAVISPKSLHDSVMAAVGDLREKMQTAYERFGRRLLVNAEFVRTCSHFYIQVFQNSLNRYDNN